MDNAQKAIMIGVGLFITIIIIAAVMLITGMGQNLLNQGQAQVNGISESLMNDLFQQYNGKKMSGAQVRTAATQLVNRDDASSFTVKISTTEIKVPKDDSGKSATDQVNAAIGTNTTKQYTGSVSKDSSTGKVTVEFK